MLIWCQRYRTGWTDDTYWGLGLILMQPMRRYTSVSFCRSGKTDIFTVLQKLTYTFGFWQEVGWLCSDQLLDGRLLQCIPYAFTYLHQVSILAFKWTSSIMPIILALPCVPWKREVERLFLLISAAQRASTAVYRLYLTGTSAQCASTVRLWSAIPALWLRQEGIIGHQGSYKFIKTSLSTLTG